MPKYNTSDRLKQIMSERNLKQIDIINMAKPYCEAYKVKLGRNDISQYVSGKVSPGQNKLYILGCALNVNEAWLMGYDISPERNADVELADTVMQRYRNIVDTASLEDLRTLEIYKKLDSEDKAEIRGEIRGMLKADKYQNK